MPSSVRRARLLMMVVRAGMLMPAASVPGMSGGWGDGGSEKGHEGNAPIRAARQVASMCWQARCQYIWQNMH